MSGSIFYRFMCSYDRLWRRWHKVEAMDPLVSLSLEKYKGEGRLMNDGSWLEPGDLLGILHFNRECFATPGSSPRDYARAALRFRRLLLASFSQLAVRFETEERFLPVKALHGVSWLPPHGEKVGFMIERLPDSWLNRFRRFYFRLLLKTFFPVLAARENQQIQPHAYWLTRNQLIQNFTGESLDKLRGKAPGNPSGVSSEKAANKTSSTVQKNEGPENIVFLHEEENDVFTKITTP